MSQLSYLSLRKPEDDWQAADDKNIDVYGTDLDSHRSNYQLNLNDPDMFHFVVTPRFWVLFYFKAQAINSVGTWTVIQRLLVLVFSVYFPSDDVTKKRTLSLFSKMVIYFIQYRWDHSLSVLSRLWFQE